MSMDDLKTIRRDCKRGTFAQTHWTHTQDSASGDESDDGGVRSSSQQRGQKRRRQDDGEEDERYESAHIHTESARLQRVQMCV